MPRRCRITVFLDDDERELLEMVRNYDDTLGVTVRRLAIKAANWMAKKGYTGPKAERPAIGEHSPDRHNPDDGPRLDTSDNQINRWS